MKKIFLIALSLVALSSYDATAQRRQLKWENVATDGTPGRLAGWDENGNPVSVNPDTLSVGGSGSSVGSANEIQKSDGAGGFDNTGVFSSADGNMTMGSATLAGATRNLYAAGSATDVSIDINAKGSGSVSLSNDNLGGVTVSGAASAVKTVVSGGVPTELTRLSSATNTVDIAMALKNETGNVPATGIGTGMQFQTETASSNYEIGATIEAVTTDVTAGSEDFDLVFKTMQAGAAANTKFTLRSYGSATFGGTYTATGLNHAFNLNHSVNGGTAPTHASLNYSNSFTFGNNGQAYYAQFINPTVTVGAFTGTTTYGIYYFASGTPSTNHYGLVIANGNTGLGHTSPDRKLAVAETDVAVSSVSYPQKISHLITSGTQAAGLGVGLEFELNTSGNVSSGNREVGGVIEAIATDVTSTSEDVDMVFKTMSAGAAANEKFRITSDGRLYGTALHNNPGSLTGTTNQYIASGTYSPTIVLDANLDSSTGSLFTWTRVGNAVSVSGMLAADPTAASTVTSLRIPLPIASNFNASENCGGTGAYILTADGTTVGAAIIRADSTNDQAFVQFYPSSTSQVTMTFEFKYTVL